MSRPRHPQIDRDSHVPLHVQLRDLLLARITGGELAVGARLPTVRSLIDAYRVSLPVVRMALEALAEERVISIEHGRGSFVAQVPQPKPGTRRVLFWLCGRSVPDPFFSRVLSGCEQAATAAGWGVLFMQVAPGDGIAAARRLKTMGVAGVVCTGDVDDESYRALCGSRVPFVIAGGPWRQELASSAVRIVGNDNHQGGRLATERLLAAGHRRIGLITGPTSGRHWKLRRLGYEVALRAAGVTPDPGLLVECPQDSSESAAQALAPLLSSAAAPTALFAGNDRYAIAAYRILQGLGRRIPDHLSVVGYDDLDFSPMLSPPLTTIHADIEGTGANAFALLLEALAGMPPRQVLQPVRLVERGSVRSVDAG